MKEYGMVVKTVDLEQVLKVLGEKELGEYLSVTLDRISQITSKILPEMKGGGWNIFSHDLCKIDDKLVVSFMVYRDLKGVSKN